jgi:hypothetical protein
MDTAESIRYTQFLLEITKRIVMLSATVSSSARLVPADNQMGFDEQVKVAPHVLNMRSARHWPMDTSTGRCQFKVALIL